MRLSDDAIYTYCLLGHWVNFIDASNDGQWMVRLSDLLLSAGFPPSASACDTAFTVRHLDTGWQLSGDDGAELSLLISNEAQLLRELEWQAYSSATRHANGPLLLHAGAVERGGTAILLPGVSGSGKTTFTLALAVRGWLPLTDDICPLTERDDALVAVGCPRCCHVSTSSLIALQALGITLEGPAGDLRGYYRPRQWGDPAPVRAIVFPRYVANSATSFVSITQAECLAHLLKAIFAQATPPAQERRQTAAKLAALVPAVELTYSNLDEALDAFETLEARLDNAEAGERRLPIDHDKATHDGRDLHARDTAPTPAR
jgi:hypothetical protein